MLVFLRDEQHLAALQNRRRNDDDDETEDLNDSNYDEVSCMISMFKNLDNSY